MYVTGSIPRGPAWPSDRFRQKKKPMASSRPPGRASCALARPLRVEQILVDNGDGSTAAAVLTLPPCIGEADCPSQYASLFKRGMTMVDAHLWDQAESPLRCLVRLSEQIFGSDHEKTLNVLLRN